MTPEEQLQARLGFSQPSSFLASLLEPPESEPMLSSMAAPPPPMLAPMGQAGPEFAIGAAQPGQAAQPPAAQPPAQPSPAQPPTPTATQFSHLSPHQRNAMLSYLKAGGDPEDALNLMAEAAFAKGAGPKTTDLMANHRYLSAIDPETADAYLASQMGEGGKRKITVTKDGRIIVFDPSTGQYGVDETHMVEEAPELTPFQEEEQKQSAKRVAALEEDLGTLQNQSQTISAMKSLSGPDSPLSSGIGSSTGDMFRAGFDWIYDGESRSANLLFDQYSENLNLNKLSVFKGSISDAELAATKRAGIDRNTDDIETIRRKIAAQEIYNNAAIEAAEIELAARQASRTGELTPEARQQIRTRFFRAVKEADAVLTDFRTWAGRFGATEANQHRQRDQAPSAAAPSAPARAPQARSATPNAPLPNAAQPMFRDLPRSPQGAQQAYERALSRRDAA